MDKDKCEQKWKWNLFYAVINESIRTADLKLYEAVYISYTIAVYNIL